MKLLITGVHGKVGRATVAAAQAAGHLVTGVDLGRPSFDRPDPGAPRYQQADLTDAGAAYALVARTRFDAVIHVAAIPEPTGNPPHVVFHNNLMGTFNLLEAAVRLGVPRFVNVSSETVPGFFFPERPFLPDYVPVDEEHPVRPQDPYALAKAFGEQLCDAAVARSDIKAITIRPSWVQTAENYARNLGPQIRDPDEPSAGFWAYIDVEDLAGALLLAAASDLPGHEVFYIASPDVASKLPLPELVRRHHGDAVPVRPLDRPDAGGISIAKARRLLGYDPQRSWRDHLDERGQPIT
ncbi:MAG TPA: NAD(P)-dependent oxidoreductase [Baekduia sp.]|uniref:NAD-dependent epimerase/dehydratase family protein n=1 Tax=Baekduia sp. TaxID=2600305 RepID=UPI002BFCEFC2|nr:NAD(P)-dependent oxidoreductase [Baekduia sp.]HMJ37415.1 NAD(P)-dependent oxidoreductase [Baekduia sp.]